MSIFLYVFVSSHYLLVPSSQADASKWNALTEDEQYRANQKLSFAERGIVPKRLHRVRCSTFRRV
jgi:hypothetical protein